MLMLREDFDRLLEAIDTGPKATRTRWRKQAKQVLEVFAKDIRSLGLNCGADFCPSIHFRSGKAELHCGYDFDVDKDRPNAKFTKPGLLGKEVARLLKSKYGIEFARVSYKKTGAYLYLAWVGGSYGDFDVRMLESFDIDDPAYTDLSVELVVH